jgi:hypothetical protein
MGGAVAVTVRKKDGTVFPMCRWTNSLPYWIKSREFIQNPEKQMEKFIEYGERSDYNHSNSRLAPEGYGLVVIDLKDNKIYTHQNYTSFNREFGLSGYSLTLNLQHNIVNFDLEESEIPYLDLVKLRKKLKDTNVIFDHSEEEISDIIDRMKDVYWLICNQRINLDKKLIDEINKERSVSEKGINVLLNLFLTKYDESNTSSIKRWKSFLKILSSNSMNFSRKPYSINLSPFEIIDYRCFPESESFSIMRDDLVDAGFDISGQTSVDWENWIKNQLE